GHQCQGYLSTPGDRQGPAVVVIQEWWGLVPHIEDVCDRFAASGFLALAPDLYHGEKASSPNDAQKLMMELDIERANKEILGAGRYLLSRDDCTSSTFGVIGFCMGGALAQYAGTTSDEVGAVVSFYGGFKKVQPDWENLQAPILLIYGSNDVGVPASGGIALQRQLREMGKNVEIKVYDDAEHAFFNDTRPEVYNEKAAEAAWLETMEIFRSSLEGGRVGS
ncbi:MAG: dienelactone hydrolase family protein, partial [Thermoanaerobaculia bacterium]|nr:dienelactone hydrolase family protein [Thermoanaerobaculia bacterium]